MLIVIIIMIIIIFVISGSCCFISCGDGFCDVLKCGVVSQKYEGFVKRVYLLEDNSFILVDSFVELDSFDDQGRVRWFVYVRDLIDKYSVGNGFDGVDNVVILMMWDFDGLE